jgi:hypothetical protein
VPLGRVDLEQILCIEDRRVVGRDNVAPTVAGAGNVVERLGLTEAVEVVYPTALERIAICVEPTVRIPPLLTKHRISTRSALGLGFSLPFG